MFYCCFVFSRVRSFVVVARIFIGSLTPNSSQDWMRIIRETRENREPPTFTCPRLELAPDWRNQWSSDKMTTRWSLHSVSRSITRVKSIRKVVMMPIVHSFFVAHVTYPLIVRSIDYRQYLFYWVNYIFIRVFLICYYFNSQRVHPNVYNYDFSCDMSFKHTWSL